MTGLLWSRLARLGLEVGLSLTRLREMRPASPREPFLLFVEAFVERRREVSPCIIREKGVPIKATVVAAD